MKKEEKMELYIRQREEFKIFKSILESRVYHFSDLKKGLRAVINQKRPITDKGELICANCDMVSMVPVEKRYGPHHDLSHDYECEVCDGIELGRYL